MNTKYKIVKSTTGNIIICKDYKGKIPKSPEQVDALVLLAKDRMILEGKYIESPIYAAILSKKLKAEAYAEDKEEAIKKAMEIAGIKELSSKKPELPKARMPKKYKLVETEDSNVIIWQEGTKRVSVLLCREKKFIPTKDLRDIEKYLRLARELPVEEEVTGNFRDAFKKAKEILGLEEYIAMY